MAIVKIETMITYSYQLNVSWNVDYVPLSIMDLTLIAFRYVLYSFLETFSAWN